MSLAGRRWGFWWGPESIPAVSLHPQPLYVPPKREIAISGVRAIRNQRNKLSHRGHRVPQLCMLVPLPGEWWHPDRAQVSGLGGRVTAEQPQQLLGLAAGASLAVSAAILRGLSTLLLPTSASVALGDSERYRAAEGARRTELQMRPGAQITTMSERQESELFPERMGKKPRESLIALPGN